MTSLKNIFWFILRHFEQGVGPYNYKPMYRPILVAVGSLFGVLCGISLYLSGGSPGAGFLIPVLVFAAVSAVCLIVALLGSDRAVAKIWGQDRGS